MQSMPPAKGVDSGDGIRHSTARCVHVVSSVGDRLDVRLRSGASACRAGFALLMKRSGRRSEGVPDSKLTETRKPSAPQAKSIFSFCTRASSIVLRRSHHDRHHLHLSPSQSSHKPQSRIMCHVCVSVWWLGRRVGTGVGGGDWRGPPRGSGIPPVLARALGSPHGCAVPRVPR